MKQGSWQMEFAWALAILWLVVGVGCFGPEKKPSPQMVPPSQPGRQMKGAPPASAPMKPAPKVEPTAEDFVHEVKWPGESLSIIAGWYTGDIQNWKALVPLNPHIRPDLIRMGDRIVIPRSMMKTQDPMPKEYVDSFVPQAGGQVQPSPSEEKPPQEEPKLFGPKPLTTK
jgi:hypothetical protein